MEADGSFSEADLLADGLAGRRGEEGRVFINGTPTVIAFYLGQPKTVTEIGLFSFNVDSRANQDFEVRLADNSQRPGDQARLPPGTGLQFRQQGHRPQRRRLPHAIRRPERRSARAGQGRLGRVPHLADVQLEAGQPAKTARAEGASAYIELEVLGTADDVFVLPPEEVARRQALAQMPQEPQYEKQATARETLIAGREAILAWEAPTRSAGVARIKACVWARGMCSAR